MKKEKPIETCSICGKKLNSWNTQLIKHEGKKICTKCAFIPVKQGFEKLKQDTNKTQNSEDKIQNTADKIGKIGKKLTRGLTIPIILFIVGLITLPIGIIFWVVGIFIFFGTFFGDKSK